MRMCVGEGASLSRKKRVLKREQNVRKMAMQNFPNNKTNIFALVRFFNL